MAYTPTAWNDDGPPPINAANLNKLEGGVQAAAATADAAAPAGHGHTGYAPTSHAHDGTYLPLAGGTLTGTLALAGDPQADADAATKRYVDARIWTGTQAQFDAIPVKDPDVLYVVTG